MNKIVLILPYFGALPPYFNFFLKSLEGKCLDVLFISDLDVAKAPPNFKAVKMSLQDVSDLAARKLGMAIELSTPKRLCDFRPMYGVIFEEYIVPYEYWARGDCDLIYGNALNAFLSRIVSEDYDIISFRKLWVSGAFTLFKNTSRINQLYLRSDNWQEVVQSTATNTTMFDEISGEYYNELLRGTMTIDDCRAIRDSFTAVVERSKDIRYFHEDVITECYLNRQTVTMTRDGDLLLNEKTILVFHYVYAKFKRYFTYLDLSYEKISDYVIDDTGFHVGTIGETLRPIVGIGRKTKGLFASLHQYGLRHIIERIRN